MGAQYIRGISTKGDYLLGLQSVKSNREEDVIRERVGPYSFFLTTVKTFSELRSHGWA